MEVTMGPGGNEMFIKHEKLNARNHVAVTRDWAGAVTIQGTPPEELTLRNRGESCLKRWLMPLQQEEWQFLTMHPQAMGAPHPQRRSGGTILLEKDGSNVAEYLMAVRRLDQAAFEGIVETLQFILPYADDVQPAITSELERNVYLQLSEAGFKVPGWLLSTGTVRLVALLALLRHPLPPPLVVIEEIENGLDPRTIHLIVDEIREAVQSGRTQVVVTTHSPYLLNLLPLQTIVLVERDQAGEPRFWRPADDDEVKEWGKRFAPGELYTTGRFKRGRQ
jgi:predicted ATPase